jgi:hypothetical protein
VTYDRAPVDYGGCRVRARCGALGCHSKLGRVGKVTAHPGNGRGDVIAAVSPDHAKYVRILAAIAALAQVTTLSAAGLTKK